MCFRLCLHLGRPHPDVLLKELTSHQLAEWMAFFSLEPFGQQHTDFLLAQLTAEMSNRWAGKGERQKAPREYLPHWKPEIQTPEQMQRNLRAILGR